MTVGTRVAKLLKDVRRLFRRSPRQEPTAQTMEAVHEEKRRQALAELERLKHQMPEN
jgi:glutamate 5-kinase